MCRASWLSSCLGFRSGFIVKQQVTASVSASRLCWRYRRSLSTQEPTCQKFATQQRSIGFYWWVSSTASQPCWSLLAFTTSQKSEAEKSWFQMTMKTSGRMLRKSKKLAVNWATRYFHHATRLRGFWTWTIAWRIQWFVRFTTKLTIHPRQIRICQPWSEQPKPSRRGNQSGNNSGFALLATTNFESSA